MKFIRKSLAVLACCAPLVLGAMAPAMGQERLAIAGTTVSVVAPKGFIKASGFAGLQNDESKASVIIVELPPEAHAQLAPLFSDLETAKLNFARQNVMLDDRDEIDTAGGKVPVLSGSQSANGVAFDKWIALYQGAKTVMITVQSPEAANLDEDEVHAMLKSVTLGAAPSLAEKLAALPFAVTVAEPFRAIDTIGGSGLLMTSGPLDADPSGRQPLVIVAAQLSGPQGAPLDQLSEVLLKQTRGFADAEIATRGTQAFAGMQGYLVTGTHGTGKRFAQYLATGADGRFVRLIATADAAQYETLQPAIGKIAASIAFKPER